MLSVASIAGRLFLPFFGQAFCRVAPFEFTPCPILKYFFLLPLTRLRRNGQVNELLKFIEMKFSYAVERRRNFRVVIPVHCTFDQLCFARCTIHRYQSISRRFSHNNLIPFVGNYFET